MNKSCERENDKSIYLFIILEWISFYFYPQKFTARFIAHFSFHFHYNYTSLSAVYIRLHNIRRESRRFSIWKLCLVNGVCHNFLLTHTWSVLYWWLKQWCGHLSIKLLIKSWSDFDWFETGKYPINHEFIHDKIANFQSIQAPIIPNFDYEDFVHRSLGISVTFFFWSHARKWKTNLRLHYILIVVIRNFSLIFEKKCRSTVRDTNIRCKKNFSTERIGECDGTTNRWG